MKSQKMVGIGEDFVWTCIEINEPKHELLEEGLGEEKVAKQKRKDCGEWAAEEKINPE